MESEERRIERLIHECDTLRLQLAKIEIERMKEQIATLRDDDIRTQVLDLASSGRSVRQIANELHLSKSAVGRIKRRWDGGRGTAVGHQH